MFIERAWEGHLFKTIRREIKTNLEEGRGQHGV